MATQIEKTPLEIIKNSDSVRKGILISIYAILVTRRNWKTNVTETVSYQSIREFTGCSRKTIDLALKELEELNLIKSRYRHGHTSVYIFPSEFKYKGLAQEPKVKEDEKAAEIFISENEISEMFNQGGNN